MPDDLPEFQILTTPSGREHKIRNADDLREFVADGGILPKKMPGKQQGTQPKSLSPEPSPYVEPDAPMASMAPEGGGAAPEATVPHPMAERYTPNAPEPIAAAQRPEPQPMPNVPSTQDMARQGGEPAMDERQQPKPMEIPETRQPEPKSMEPFMPPPSGGKTADAFTMGEILHGGTKVAMAAAGLAAGGPAGMMAGGMIADSMKPKRPDDDDQGFVPSLGVAHQSDLQSSQRKKKGSSFPALRDQIGMSESDQIVSAFRR